MILCLIVVLRTIMFNKSLQQTILANTSIDDRLSAALQNENLILNRFFQQDLDDLVVLLLDS